MTENAQSRAQNVNYFINSWLIGQCPIEKAPNNGYIYHITPIYLEVADTEKQVSRAVGDA